MDIYIYCNIYSESSEKTLFFLVYYITTIFYGWNSRYIFFCYRCTLYTLSFGWENIMESVGKKYYDIFPRENIIVRDAVGLVE